MTVREFRPEDADKLYSILLSSFDEFFRPEVFYHFSSLWPQGQLVACDIIGEPIGFLFSTRTGDNLGRIMLFAVSPQYRSRGIGQELLNRFRLVCMMTGIHGMTLEVKPTNTRAIKFYRRNGFRETEVLYSFYQDGESAMRMNGPVQMNF